MSLVVGISMMLGNAERVGEETTKTLLCLTDDEPAESVSEHFDPEPSERSLGSHLSLDSDPQTDTDDDTSLQTMTSNWDHCQDKA